MANCVRPVSVCGSQREVDRHNETQNSLFNSGQEVEPFFGRPSEIGTVNVRGDEDVARQIVAGCSRPKEPFSRFAHRGLREWRRRASWLISVATRQLGSSAVGLSRRATVFLIDQTTSGRYTGTLDNGVPPTFSGSISTRKKKKKKLQPVQFMIPSGAPQIFFFCFLIPPGPFRRGLAKCAARQPPLCA